MGSNPAPCSPDHEINVLITGFGPFKMQYPVNPSWEIAHSLPPLIPLFSRSSALGRATAAVLPANPSSAAAAGGETSTPTVTSTPTLALRAPPPQIRLLVHPEPVRVAYKAVRGLVPRLWDGEGAMPGDDDRDDGDDDDDDDEGAAPGRRQKRRGEGSERGRQQIDFCVHVGMAGGKTCYAAERRGHRDGYNMRDVDGIALGDERGKGWVWEGCPEELCSDLDLGDVWRRWTAALPDLDLRVSEDAGRYLCDFIYYSSLAHLWKKGEDRRVVFLHVPAQSDPISISRGREVLIELVRAMVLSRGLERVMADRNARIAEMKKVKEYKMV